MNMWRRVLAFAAIALSLSAGTVYAKPYKGAEIITRETFKYGAFETRLKAAKGSGQITAFFLWKHNSEIPGVGWQEQDFEIFGKNGNFQSQLMTPGTNGEIRTEQGVYHTVLEPAYDDYHTYRMEWTPTYLAFYYDGKLIRFEDGTKEPGKTTYRQMFSVADPAQLRINMWAGDWSWSGAFDPTALPGATFVEYLEVYNYTPGTGMNGSNFSLRWRDDFTNINTNRWWFANWTFSYAVNDYVSQNARSIDGKLVMVLTDEANVGKFPAVIPPDNRTNIPNIPAPKPYAPTTLPGKVEAETTSAFFDTTPVNQGDLECGTTPVDAEITNDSGGGCAVGWLQAGEWTEYKIIAPQNATYDFVLRASSGASNARLHLEIDGVNVSGTIRVPQGDWSIYQNIPVTINVAAGTRTLRVVYDTGRINLNHIDIRAPGTTDPDEEEPTDPDELPTAVLVPARIEAEDFQTYLDTTIANLGSAGCGTASVDSEVTADVDGGCNIAWTVSGEWLEYHIHAVTTDTYRLKLRTATIKDSGRLGISVDGVKVSTVRIPMTGWFVYTDVFVDLPLTAGTHKLKVHFENGSVNLNYLEIE